MKTETIRISGILKRVGEYEILKQLGEGGIGIVYLARNIELGKYVAIKSLQPSRRRDKYLTEKILQEARLMAKLGAHPNIVDVIGQLYDDEGYVYIVMEYITREGRDEDGHPLPAYTLDYLIKKGVSKEEALRIFKKILSAVDYAHEEEGVIHRDLKPENILIDRFGEIKITDFGIAKVISEGSVTTASAIIGTPPYMAPEQIENEEIGFYTDIYALGIIFFQLLTGKYPYEIKKDTPISYIDAHRRYQPQLELIQDIALREIVRRCLEKKPEDRYQRVEELLEDIEKIGKREAKVGVKPKEKGPEKVIMPLLVGKTKESAIKELERLGLKYSIKYIEGKDGIVLGQDVTDGVRVERGRLVEIVVGRGAKPPVFPEGSVKEKKVSVFAWLVPLLVIGIVVFGVIMSNKSNQPPPSELGVQTTSPPGVGTPVPSSRPALTYLGKNSKGYEEYRHNKTGIILIKIPAGAFTMGSDASDAESDEKPVHTVYLDEYYIGKYEVTNAQYKKFCDATGRSYPEDPDFTAMPNYFTNFPDYPVVNVSWEDARAFCDWAGLRLPTEAEWEKAARGTDGRKYPWGNEEPGSGGFVRCNYADKNTDYEWSDKSANDGYQFTSPVGTYERGVSPYGCYDMAGNVGEWCADWYDRNYYSRSANNNPQGPSSGNMRVVRGGSWDIAAEFIRCANRSCFSPTDGFEHYGFRVGSPLR